MAWTTIPDARLEPDAPVRSVDALALRDNPIAIANGDAGAPKVQTAGIQDLAVTTAKIANLDVTNGKLANLAVTEAKIDNGAVSAAKLYTSSEEESQALGAGAGILETFASVGQYGFYPLVKASVNPTNTSYQITYGNLGVGYSTRIYMQNLEAVNRTLYAYICYVHSCRDYPVVYISRDKITGEIHGVHFDPECSGYNHPMDLHNIANPEVLVIELKRNENLCRHLFEHFSQADNSWCYQIGLGLFTGVLKLGNKVDPMLPNMDDHQKRFMRDIGLIRPNDVTKTECVPALYSPEVKVVDFKFDEKLLAKLEG